MSTTQGLWDDVPKILYLMDVTAGASPDHHILVSAVTFPTPVPNPQALGLPVSTVLANRKPANIRKAYRSACFCLDKKFWEGEKIDNRNSGVRQQDEMQSLIKYMEWPLQA
jgi:hypothetical protein